MRPFRLRLTREQRGFTLIELVIATALIGIITAAFSGFLFQIIKTDQSSNNRVTAVRNLDTAGNWLVLDFQSAQTLPPVVTLTPGAGNLTLYQSVGDIGDSIVVYSIDSAKDLCRTVGANTSRVAQNITSVAYITGTASTPSSVTVTATVGPSQFSKTFKITSRISNSNAELTILTTALPEGDVGVPYYQTVIAYGGSMPYTYEITSGALPAWANSADLSAGEIDGSLPTLGTSSFTVTVTDAAGTQVSSAFSLKINPVMSNTITPATLTPGFVGEPYGPVQFQVSSGGSSPFYWYCSDTLPAGLDLNLGGSLSGTPTISGNTTFTLVVTDAAGDTRTVSRSIDITVIPAQFMAASIFSDSQTSQPTTVSPVGGAYPAQKLSMVATPKNHNYHSIIHCSIQNKTAGSIKVKGVTAANGSGGVISVAYGGVLLGNTSIPAGQTDNTGTITLSASSGGGPWTIEVTYQLN
jgi:prepilin-type N-terminal cleavage/methylation domain-containing protein